MHLQVLVAAITIFILKLGRAYMMSRAIEIQKHACLARNAWWEVEMTCSTIKANKS
jgi:hypothetical protein